MVSDILKLSLTFAATLLVLPACSTSNEPPRTSPPPTAASTLRVVANGVTFRATLRDNASVADFVSMLPLTLTMSDFNANEKVSSLPRSLVKGAVNPHTIRRGDLMLYGSSSLVLFYETFATSYSYTPLGSIDDVQALKRALGSGSVVVTFELE